MWNLHLGLFKLYSGIQNVDDVYYILFINNIEMKIKYLQYMLKYVEKIKKNLSGVYLLLHMTVYRLFVY